MYFVFNTMINNDTEFPYILYVSIFFLFCFSSNIHNTTHMSFFEVRSLKVLFECQQLENFHIYIIQYADRLLNPLCNRL